MPSLRLRSGAAVLGALALAALPFALRPAGAAAATTTLTVTTDADPASGTACPATAGNPCSLRTAVVDANAAGSGATVVIDFAVAGPITDTQGALPVSGGENLTIQGSTAGSTVIEGSGTDRVIAMAGFGCNALTTSSLTLSHVTLRNGDAVLGGSGDDGFGGAVDIDCANVLNVVDSTVLDNTAGNGGGGINDNTTGTVTLLRSTVSGNTTTGTGTSTPADGGGGVELSTAGTFVAIDSTFAGNDTRLTGGAIYAVTGSTLTLVNDTIAGNTDSGSPPPPFTATGGVFAEANITSSVTNTIVSGNTPANCTGTLTDGGHDLEQGTSCGFSSNAINADPLLDTLKDNGGPAQTMALKPGSKAIDAGGDTACSAKPAATPAGAGGLDERSVTRPQGAHCDIGAFEVVATTTQLSAPLTATPGQGVNLVATVSPAQAIPGQPTGTVTFLNGSTVLGTASLSGAGPDTASLGATVPSGGFGALTARYEGSPDFLPSTSPAVTAAAPSPSSSAGGVISTPNTGGAAPSTGAPALAALALAGGAALLAGRRRRRR